MLAQPTAPSPVPIAASPTTAAAAAPRKRRRRAPASGAAEDCFSCRGKGVKCDRRRPYCGPCLEVGTDCGGYRTQLTWGVGVASRGKLRGMTLPISLDTVPSIPGVNTKAQLKKRSPSVEKAVPIARKIKPAKDVDSMEGDFVASSAPENKRLSIASSYDFVNVGSPINSSQNVFPVQQRNSQPRPTISTTLLTNVSSSYPSFQPISPPRQEFPLNTHFQHKGYEMSSASPESSPVLLSPMSEYTPSYGGMHSPFALSPVNSNGSLFEMGMDSTSTSAYHPMSLTATSGPGHFDGMHSDMNSSLHHNTNLHQHSFRSHSLSQSFGGSELSGSHPQLHSGSGNLSALLYGDDMLALGDSDYQFSPPSYSSQMPRSCPGGLSESSQSYQSSIHDSTPLAASPMHIPCLLPPQLADKSPELRYLVDYYDRTVCPALVAFDGPGNPYRSHILRMAFHNDALMEAVYALSSSHLHQRRNGSFKADTPFSGIASYGTPDSSSMISPINSLDDIHGSHQVQWGRSQSVPDIDFFDGGASDSSISGMSASLEHKSSSIRMLNAQLANPALATTDSAMATLLLLCLYHVCESGQGQFRTHLAGVKKLMSMRGAGNANQRWTWMETVFTWLENMSAPMNNRFSQLDAAEYMESICDPSGDWDIESLTGCDRELFIKISKLSMVNMLSQQPASNVNRRWMVPNEQEEDEWEQPRRNEDDGRVEFWEAWNSLRKDLTDWNPSPRFAATSSRQRMSDSVTSISSIHSVDSGFASMNSTSPNSPVLSGFRTGPSFSPRKMSFKAQEAVETNHWLHASNVHRCAALLYLDRLAYPHLSSSHPIFQNTVRKVLDHMTCIPTSSGLNKTLFWPLFVTASEAVVDAHRELIRQRCYSMQTASGFFSKVAGLDILERIWSEDEDMMMGGLETDESIGGRGLKWRKVASLDDGTEHLFI